MGGATNWVTWLQAGLLNTAIYMYDILFQTWGMRHLPAHIDDVGGPVAGLTAIVTGPTSGIGEETAATLARRGAKVVLACRSLSRGEALKARLLDEAKAAGRPQPELEVRELDLASLASVRRFAAGWEAEGRPLHLLVNNAGVFTIGAPRSETSDGFEMHLGSNHLGHFLLTLLLLPALRRGAKAPPPPAGNGSAANGHQPPTDTNRWPLVRVVTVSSSFHALARKGINLTDPQLTRPGSYNSDLAYAQSKLANILFTRELRRRLAASPLPEDREALAPGVLAVHPGLVCTGVARGLPAWMQVAYQVIMGRILLTSMQGARASVYAATSPSAPAEAAPTGGYFDANCTPLQPATPARDDAAAAWLWRWSAEQVALPRERDLPEP